MPRHHRGSRPLPQLSPGTGESSSSATTVRGDSGVSYNVNDSSGRTAARLTRGVQDVNIQLNDYRVAQGEDGHPYYAFQFTDQMTIRVGATESQYPVPECTCGANEDGVSCSHIFYFINNVYPLLNQQQSSLPVPVSEDASHVGGRTTYDMVREIGVEEIVNHLPHNEHYAQSPAESLVTIVQLQHHVVQAFVAFDEWTLYNGASSKPTLNVSSCAERLEQLVLEIRAACNGDHAPQHWETTTQAVAILIELLKGLLKRNRNVHAITQVAWGGMAGAPAAEDSDASNNVYTRMMRYNPQREGAGAFDALNAIGHDVLFEYTDVLRELILNAYAAGLADRHKSQAERLLGRLSEAEAARGSRRRRGRR